MRSPALKYYVLSLLIMVIEIVIFFAVFQRSFQPVPGATFIEAGQQCLLQTARCDTAGTSADVTLPVLVQDRTSPEPLALGLQFVWQVPTVPEGITAIYLPKISEAVQIRVNGVVLTDMIENGVGEGAHLAPTQSSGSQKGDSTSNESPDPLTRNWNHPVLVTVPANLIQATNLIEISVFGYPQDGAGLHPFYVGPVLVLEPMYDRRWFATKGVALLGMAFMVLSTVLFGSLYLTGVRRETYGWLTVASICAGVFNSHFAFSAIPFSFWAWTIIWNVAIHLLVCSLYKFILRYVGLPVGKYEKRYWIVVVAGVSVLLLAPKDYIFEVTAAFSVLSVVVGVGGLVSLCLGRKNLGVLPFITLYCLFSIALSIAGHDWIFMFVRPSPIHLHIGQYALPMIMTISIWLIMTDLMRTATENEVLNQELQTTVDVTTQRLQKTYEQLAIVEKRQILETERQRIMFDLHDGVGGQLVNTLAYMQTDGEADPTVRASIESMLRDLGLMIDSLEAHDNLTTSLGMLRARLEPLLERTGMTFIWQVKEEPITPGTGPTLSLNVLRIAQEAITNAVKHANATEISVETDTRSITIRDNGKGFTVDGDTRRSGKNSGLGIVGMKKRAKDIGAELTIQSTTTGTAISLNWKPE